MFFLFWRVCLSSNQSLSLVHFFLPPFHVHPRAPCNIFFLSLLLALPRPFLSDQALNCQFYFSSWIAYGHQFFVLLPFLNYLISDCLNLISVSFREFQFTVFLKFWLNKSLDLINNWVSSFSFPIFFFFFFFFFSFFPFALIWLSTLKKIFFQSNDAWAAGRPTGRLDSTQSVLVPVGWQRWFFGYSSALPKQAIHEWLLPHIIHDIIQNACWTRAPAYPPVFVVF